MLEYIFREGAKFVRQSKYTISLTLDRETVKGLPEKGVCNIHLSNISCREK